MSRLVLVLTSALLFVPASLAQNVGIFENHVDVGTVLHPGSIAFDPQRNAYTVRGSGENMWATTDAFQFDWKKMSGDVEITADVRFTNLSGNEHKKAVLIFRQSLGADSVYADVALHASGLTSLQYRDEKGAVTHEIQSGDSPGHFYSWESTLQPWRLRLTRRGEYVYMSMRSFQPIPHYNGESIRIALQGDFYVGVGV